MSFFDEVRANLSCTSSSDEWMVSDAQYISKRIKDYILAMSKNWKISEKGAFSVRFSISVNLWLDKKRVSERKTFWSGNKIIIDEMTLSNKANKFRAMLISVFESDNIDISQWVFLANRYDDDDALLYGPDYSVYRLRSIPEYGRIDPNRPYQQITRQISATHTDFEIEQDGKTIDLSKLGRLSLVVSFMA